LTRFLTQIVARYTTPVDRPRCICRLLPLVEKFAELLQAQTAFVEMFGAI